SWVACIRQQLMPGLILGVVTTAFIPSFMRSSSRGDEVDWRGLNTLFTFVGLIVIAISAIVVLARDPLVSAMAPSVPPEVHALAVKLTALMAIAVLFFGVNAMLSAIMQS